MGPPDDLSCPLGQSQPYAAVEFPGSPCQRAEPRRSRQVVADPVTTRYGPGRSGELAVGIHRQSGLHLACIRHIQPITRQPFVQEPDAPGIGTGGCVPNHLRELPGIDRAKESCQHAKAHSLPLERKLEVAPEGVFDCMPGREHQPLRRGLRVMPVGNGRQAGRERNPEVVPGRKGGVPGRTSGLRDGVTQEPPVPLTICGKHSPASQTWNIRIRL